MTDSDFAENCVLISYYMKKNIQIILDIWIHMVKIAGRRTFTEFVRRVWVNRSYISSEQMSWAQIK